MSTYWDNEFWNRTYNPFPTSRDPLTQGMDSQGEHEYFSYGNSQEPPEEGEAPSGALSSFSGFSGTGSDRIAARNDDTGGSPTDNYPDFGGANWSDMGRQQFGNELENLIAADEMFGFSIPDSTQGKIMKGAGMIGSLPMPMGAGALFNVAAQGVNRASLGNLNDYLTEVGVFEPGWTGLQPGVSNYFDPTGKLGERGWFGLQDIVAAVPNQGDYTPGADHRDSIAAAAWGPGTTWSELSTKQQEQAVLEAELADYFGKPHIGWNQERVTPNNVIDWNENLRDSGHYDPETGISWNQSEDDRAGPSNTGYSGNTDPGSYDADAEDANTGYSGNTDSGSYDADAEDANDGGGGGDGGCYITTATMGYLGEDDDGPTLTILRWFRDHVLSKTSEGLEKIKKYYEIAPSLVKKIDPKTYEFLFKEYIEPSVNHVLSGNYKEAERTYEDMVSYLENTYR